ncbi:hypothetical protein DXX93_10335 [Thalassotalea euphylliae]|uniref:Uncharacterized protein n=1 Tax=Thalassotalea euphylliae TaxID=1655234 RepID=A0A3E0TRH6_9GAMM|nr:AHH domain-containing protein [Thalassotalea euphylliae]REL26927.1 hypothetical protein DXX93_10335 [Thalassotalea euphylliae]
MSDQIDNQIEGTVDKDTKYRDRLQREIMNNDNHPFNNGIHMAAHHLVSKEAVKLAKMRDLLVHKGYNINLVENLVFLPSTLQGACQLRVQLHRGDHTYALPDQKPYHDQVTASIEKIKGQLRKCTLRTQEDSSEVQQRVDKESVKILKRIAEFRVPLTSIFRNFKPSSKVGCSNQNEVKECEGSLVRCHHERSHVGQINYLNPYAEKRKVSQTMNYTKSHYQLKVGS